MINRLLVLSCWVWMSIKFSFRKWKCPFKKKRGYHNLENALNTMSSSWLMNSLLHILYALRNIFKTTYFLTYNGRFEKINEVISGESWSTVNRKLNRAVCNEQRKPRKGNLPESSPFTLKLIGCWVFKKIIGIRTIRLPPRKKYKHFGIKSCLEINWTEFRLELLHVEIPLAMPINCL